jgi:hypothetical protein
VQEATDLIKILHGLEGKMLTVLTTKIWPSKPRVREEYTTSFMHIFDTNKVPRVVLQILWTGTHLGKKWSQRATRARHGRTNRHDRPCRCGRPCPVPRPRSRTLPSLRAQLGWTRSIKEMLVWSNGWSCDHLDQWVHLSGRSTTTTVIPRASWASPSEGCSCHNLGVGRPHLEGWPHSQPPYQPKPMQGTNPQPPQEQGSGVYKSRGGKSQGRTHLPIRPHLWKWAHALNRPHLPIKGASHPLDHTQHAGASHFHSLVHLE